MPLHQLVDVFAQLVDALCERCYCIEYCVLDRHHIQHDLAPRLEQLGVDHTDNFCVGHNGRKMRPGGQTVKREAVAF